MLQFAGERLERLLLELLAGVGRGSCHHVDGGRGAGAGAVVHDKRLVEPLAEVLSDQPRDTCAAGMMGNSDEKNK